MMRTIREAIPNLLVFAILIGSVLSMSSMSSIDAAVGPDRTFFSGGTNGTGENLTIVPGNEYYSRGDNVVIDIWYSGEPGTNITYQVVDPDGYTKVLKKQKYHTTQFEVLDYAGDVGRYTDMAMDGDGYFHIAYIDETNEVLKYASDKDGKWKTSEVEDSTDLQWPSITVDSKGHPHVLYFDTSFDILSYAKWSGTKWTDVNFGSSTTHAWSSDIVLDDDDDQHIAYVEASGDLMYAFKNGSGWDHIEVDGSSSKVTHVSMVLKPNGSPLIKYRHEDDNELKLATWNSSSFDLETVDTDGEPGAGTGMYLDDNGDLHLAYQGNSTKGKLRYAVKNGSSWTYTTQVHGYNIDSSTSMDIDPDGDLHVLSTVKNNESLAHSMLVEGTWTTDIYDDNGSVSYPSIVVDAHGNINLAYYDRDGKDLGFGFISTTGMAYNPLTFKLPGNATYGNWTVYAVVEGGNTTANCTFLVVTEGFEPTEKRLEFFVHSISTTVQAGERFNVTINVSNYFSSQKTFYPALQLWDPENTPMPTSIRMYSINANTTDTFDLSVMVPGNAKKGTYDHEINICNELPMNGGWSFQSRKGTVEIT